MNPPAEMSTITVRVGSSTSNPTLMANNSSDSKINSIEQNTQNQEINAMKKPTATKYSALDSTNTTKKVFDWMSYKPHTTP